MDDIVVEQSYSYSLEQVWEALTDPAALAEWLMPGEFKPIVGHKVRLHCEPRAEFDGSVEVEVLKVEKPRLLSYSWKTSDMHTPTTVTYTLNPLPGGGTRLRLVHAGFAGDNGRLTHSLFKDGWGHKLAIDLPDVLSEPPGREASRPCCR